MAKGKKSVALLRVSPPSGKGAAGNQPDRFHDGCRYLCRVDPVLRALIRDIGPCRLKPRRDYFVTLCDSIISQQLSVMAAATIFDRFVLLYPSRRATPDAVAVTRIRRLRASGLSQQKASYIKDLAQGFRSGRLQPRRFVRQSNHEIIEALSSIRGVGRWTAEMFLIFSLNRLDVLPVDDLGIQKAVKRWYGLRTLPKPDKLRAIASPWTPYETLASWYLWQSARL